MKRLHFGISGQEQFEIIWFAWEIGEIAPCIDYKIYGGFLNDGMPYFRVYKENFGFFVARFGTFQEAVRMVELQFNSEHPKNETKQTKESNE